MTGKVEKTNHQTFKIYLFSNKPIKTLAVYFGYEREECDSLNWATNIELCKQLINNWKARNLTYFRTVTVIKSIILSKLTYLLQSVSIKKEQSVSVKKEQSVSVKKEQSVSVKKEQSVSVKKEQSVSIKKEQSVSVKKEQLVSVKKEQSVSVKKEQFVSVKKEQSVSVKKEQSVSVKKEQSVSVKKEQSVSVKKEQLVSVKGIEHHSIYFYGTVNQKKIKRSRRRTVVYIWWMFFFSFAKNLKLECIKSLKNDVKI